MLDLLKTHNIVILYLVNVVVKKLLGIANLGNGLEILDKCKINFFFFAGCLVTAGILGLGLRSLVKGNKNQSQKLMRMRVIAQGVTVAAIVASIMAAAPQNTQNSVK